MPEAAVAVKPANRDRPPPVVVTSDTLDAYIDSQLGPLDPATPAGQEKPAAAPAAEPATPKPEEKALGESKEPAKAAETPVEEEPEHKQNPRLQKRFSELTKARDDAKALAEQHEAKSKKESEAREALEQRLKEEADAREAAERRAAELQAKYEPPKSDEIGQRPQRAQFVNEEEYDKALEEWAGEKAIRDREVAEANERQKAAEAQRAKAWRERQQEVRKAIPDYDAKIAASAVKVSDHVRDAILESDVGPQLLYHIADNPDVADRLQKLTATSALRELGKIEAKLTGEKPPAKEEPKKETKVEPAAKPSTPVAEISKAPEPITPVRGSGTVDVYDPNVQMDYQKWKALRKAGKIR
jgi:hypothetical protein